MLMTETEFLILDSIIINIVEMTYMKQFYLLVIDSDKKLVQCLEHTLVYSIATILIYL